VRAPGLPEDPFMVLVFRDLEEHVATILQDPIDLRDDSLDVPDKGMVYDPCR